MAIRYVEKQCFISVLFFFSPHTKPPKFKYQTLIRYSERQIERRVTLEKFLKKKITLPAQKPSPLPPAIIS